ncbi:hypothetical protein [Arsenicicoccus dermatophilus]|uniref:hypothetical protein n=1 Tax=Arsenicicoccus dermatophilus TaxID=1076331 RepID=UPI001F4C98C5|nr:hypothetical protein [Arsenicicoccus dermatophilus]MCH8614464.1 hypothetical protein [Arsenicicoccus dermatophilus]
MQVDLAQRVVGGLREDPLLVHLGRGRGDLLGDHLAQHRPELLVLLGGPEQVCGDLGWHARHAAAGERPSRVKGYNYLLVGLAPGMTAEEEKALSTGDAEGQRTDWIILVHVFGTGQKSAMVSLPATPTSPSPGTARTRSTPPSRSAVPSS